MKTLTAPATTVKSQPKTNPTQVQIELVGGPACGAVLNIPTHKGYLIRKKCRYFETNQYSLEGCVLFRSENLSESFIESTNPNPL